MKYVSHGILLVSALFFFMAVIYFNVRIFGSQEDHKRNEDAFNQERYSMQDPMADTDGDGLLNWEEELYGTSKRNPDSDGDGIPDGQDEEPLVPAGLYIGNQEVQNIQEDTEKYTFTQESSPTSMDDLVKNISTVLTDQGSEAADPAQSDMQNGIKLACANAVASLLDNTYSLSAQDINVLNSYMVGSTTNQYPIDLMIQSLESSSKALATNIKQQSCVFIKPLLVSLVSEQDKQTNLLRKIRDTSREDESFMRFWQSYGESVLQFSNIIKSIGEKIGSSNLEVGSNDPAQVFIFSQPNL